MGVIFGCLLVIIISSFGIKTVKGDSNAALKGIMLFMLMGLIFVQGKKKK